MRTSDITAGKLLQSYLAVAIYKSHAEIEAAVIELLYSGFDFLKLTSIDRNSGCNCDRWGHQCSGLYCVEIPIDSVPRYETALNTNKSILIAQWTSEEVACGGEEINRTHPESVDEY